METDGRFELLRVHHKAAVSGDRHHSPIRIQQLGSDRARQPDPHRGKAIRDNAGIRGEAWKHSGHPQLVGPHVADHDIIGRERRSQFADHMLRSHRPGGPAGKLGLQPRHDRLPAPLSPSLVERRESRSDLIQRQREIAEHADVDGIVGIHLSRRHVHMHHVLVPIWVPEAGCVFHEVIAHGNHHIGLLEHGRRIVPHLETKRI